MESVQSVCQVAGSLMPAKSALGGDSWNTWYTTCNCQEHEIEMFTRAHEGKVFCVKCNASYKSTCYVFDSPNWMSSIWEKTGWMYKPMSVCSAIPVQRSMHFAALISVSAIKLKGTPELRKEKCFVWDVIPPIKAPVTCLIHLIGRVPFGKQTGCMDKVVDKDVSIFISVSAISACRHFFNIGYQQNPISYKRPQFKIEMFIFLKFSTPVWPTWKINWGLFYMKSSHMKISTITNIGVSAKMSYQHILSHVTGKTITTTIHPILLNNFQQHLGNQKWMFFPFQHTGK